jgi:hypothetical protein
MVYHHDRKKRSAHDLIACDRVPDTDIRYTPFMNQHGGNAVSDLYECPACKRRGRFLQARNKGIACDGRGFVRTASPLEMEVARRRASGEWPPKAEG